MLGLKLETDPRWVNIAEKEISEILTDHAYCEQKAASTCISLILQFYQYPEITEAVAPVVSEEWAHFRMVIAELKKRNLSLGEPRPDRYVNELLKLERKGGQLTRQLMDRLLICALIEARSCERFRLLSMHCSDRLLRNFYHEFMVSEAGHYVLFVELAKKFRPEDEVNNRLQDLLIKEAEIIRSLEPRSDRIH